MEFRPFGSTGESLSIIGLGGVVFAGMSQQDSNSIVSEAIDNGINYFDVAPSYGKEQETEIKLGEALEPYRSKSFLACKTTCREAASAREELERSLKYLRTDHFDLYQLHAISSIEDVDRCFGPGGAMETVLAARAEGKIKWVGFSAHSAEAALKALDLFDFQSVLFPVNFVTWSQGLFGPQIMAKAKERGAARLALKAMARTSWPEGAERIFPNCWYEPLADPRLAELALRYTLSMDVTAAVPPGDPRLFRLAMQFASRFTPITADETTELLQLATNLDPIFRAA